MKQRKHRFCVALVAFVLCAAMPVSAGRIDFSTAFCMELVVDFEPERVWVPVGCEVVDCCPGCPGPPIDWRILVAGDLLENVTLRFENLPAEMTRQLGIKGSGRWEGSTLQVGRGETVLSGFKVGDGAATPVAIPRLNFNKEGVRKLQETAQREADADAARAGQEQPPPSGKSPDAKDAGRVEVSIQQMMGDYVVNETRMSYVIILCPRPSLPDDQIDLNNNTTNDNAVVLLDARNGAGACVNDQVWRGDNIIHLGSVRSNGTCNSEVAVFSDDNAMQFRTPVNAWTDSLGDVLPVNMTPLLLAPVSVWVVADGRVGVAGDDIANANLLYNSNNVGIGFNATIQDLTANAGAEATIGTGCANVAAIEASAFFTPNRLNVYYVNSAFTGVNCGANRSIQFVGTTANNQTLAHEFGHSFSLVPSAAGGHTNGLPGFGTNNIMQGGGAGRTHFSEGQSFRMNVNNTSTLNVNGVRTGPVRNPACAPNVTSNICPALALDVTPK